MNKKIILMIFVGIFLFVLLNCISAIVIQSVTSTPSEIKPGENANVVITIKNNENIDIEDFSMSLDFSNVPFAPSDKGSGYSINEILEGKEKDVYFEVVASNDAKAGIYKIPVLIAYKNENGIITQQSMISLRVNSNPIIESSIEDGIFLKGQRNTISIKVVNKGLSDAKFLEIETKSSSFFTLLSADNVYIGDVDSNDFQTAEFNIFIKENAPSSINIPVTIRYRDYSNKEYSKVENLNVKVYDSVMATNLGLIPKNNTFYIVIIIIVLIIVFIIYRIFRRKRHKNNN